MNCKQARQRLAVSPREWSEIDRREVEAHLRSCSDCAALAHTYAAQEQLLSALPRAGLSLAQRQSLLDKTLVEMSRPEVSRRMPAQKFAMLWQRSRQLASGVVAFVALAALVVALIAMFSAAGQRTVASTAPTAPALSSMVTLSPTPSPAAGGSRTEVITYTVRPGDNIFSIAARFNLQAETILWANEATLASDPQRIQPGVVLTILPVDGLYYRWQAGDDLAEVAKRYNVEPDDILNWPGNHLDRQHLSIQPGTMLIIPGAVTASLAAEQGWRPEGGPTPGGGKLEFNSGGGGWGKSLPPGVCQRLTIDGPYRRTGCVGSGPMVRYLS